MRPMAQMMSKKPIEVKGLPKHMGHWLDFQPDGERVMMIMYGPRGGLRAFMAVSLEDLIDALRELEKRK